VENAGVNDRTLNRLFRRYRSRNDGAALAAVFDATARELLDVACHLVRDAAAAEDAVQETFLAAIRGAARWDASRPVKAWLYGILWREAAKTRRRAAMAGEPVRLAERGELGRLDSAAALEPGDALAAREIPEAVEAALARLPERYREVLAPLVRDGAAPDEIARGLGRAPGTVRSQIHRGLERLRRLLPGGLAATPAVFAVPGGTLPRGLAAVRGEVLGAAGFPAGSAALAATPLLVKLQLTTLGGILMTKTAMWIAAATTVALLSIYAMRGDEQARGAGALSPRGAAQEHELAGNAAASPEPGRRDLVDGAEPARDAATSSTPPTPDDDPAVDPVAYWLARFHEAPDDWRHGWSVAAEIEKLPPDEALAVMTGVWPHLTVAVKEQALKPFVFGTGHPHALKLLDLAARDASLSVQSRAFTYLKNYAFVDFASDYAAYQEWSTRWSDRPVDEVLTAGARKLASDLLNLAPQQLALRLAELERLDLDTGEPYGLDLAATIREAGGLQGLATALSLDDADAVRTALRWSKTLEADEAWLRAHVLPAVLAPETVDQNAVGDYLSALGRADCGWAQPALLAHLERIGSAPPVDPLTGADQASGVVTTGAFDAARALADIGDPAAIPALIDVLANDRSGELGYAIGHFGLSKLTGVTWHESQDAAWWLDWWEKNRERLPAEVRGAAPAND